VWPELAFRNHQHPQDVLRQAVVSHHFHFDEQG
jgi:hypothetical protein